MYREVHLGQQLYFVLWDDQGDQAGVARGEVVQYASDWSKVRVKVVEAAQLGVVGRTTWVLPDRLDLDPRSARRNYQRRARQELRGDAPAAEGRPAAANGEEGDPNVAESRAQPLWRTVMAAWADVEILLDTIDFEAGWPEHQERLAKLATIAVLRVAPAIRDLLGEVPAGDAADAVRSALDGGALGAAQTLCAGQPLDLFERWADLSLPDSAGAADQLVALRSALAELGAGAGLEPALEVGVEAAN